MDAGNSSLPADAATQDRPVIASVETRIQGAAAAQASRPPVPRPRRGWPTRIARLILIGLIFLAVPALASADFTKLAWILTGFLVASGLIGYIWAPSNAGKSLEQLDAERQAN